MIELLLSMGANRSIITNDGKTALQIAKDMVGFTKEVKEGIQILVTCGLPGYVPWKPTPDPKATATTTVTQETTTLPRSQTSPDNPTMTNMYSPQTRDAYQVPSFQANVFVQASQPPQGSPTQYDTEPSPSPYTIPEAQGTMPLRPRFQSEPQDTQEPDFASETTINRLHDPTEVPDTFAESCSNVIPTSASIHTSWPRE